MAIDTTKNYKQINVVVPARLPLGGLAGLNGIGFPAAQVQNAGVNVLDDYEEGNWTPALDAESAQVGAFTYSTQTGRYTKIGRLVHAVFQMAWTAKPSAGVVVRIGGLPFAVAESLTQSGSISFCQGITFTARAGGTGSQLTVSSYAATYCCLYTFGSGSSFGDGRLDMSSLAAAGNILGHVIYYAAT